MKRIWAVAVALCVLLIGIPTTALAIDDELTASTLDEFVLALESAEDGDVITITDFITLTNAYCLYGSADKTVTIRPVEGFTSSFSIISVSNSDEEATITLQNLIFEGNNVTLSAIWFYGVGNIVLDSVKVSGFAGSWPQLYLNQNTNVQMNNCIVQDCTNASGIQVWNGACLEMDACTISTCLANRSAGAIKNNGTLILNDCELSDNQAGYNTTDFHTGGAIENGGECVITRGSITGNNAKVGGGINNTGVLSLTDTYVYGNTSGLPQGSDIFNSGSSLTITYTGELTAIYSDEGLTPLGWYTDYNGQESVYYGIDFTATEPAALVFRQEATSPPVDPPPVEPDPPTQPVDPIPPVEPEPSTEPEEPEPYTPPAIYIPSRPDKPTPAPEPEPEPETITLSCGGAELDTEKTVVLYGYGDGLSHEDDYLTRAQGAIIIFRLLTSGSIEALYTKDNSFSDVNFDMWHNEAVSTIARAGIAQGVGGGLFNPDGVLTWAELVTLISRFVEPQSVELVNINVDGHWCNSYIQTAVYFGWLADSGDFEPDKPVTRGEAVDYINNVLTACRG